MAVSAQTLHDLIAAGLPDAQVEIHDLAGDGEHYKAVITSASFIGLSRVAQHQRVYATLQGAMKNQLHALAIETNLPALKEGMKNV